MKIGPILRNVATAAVLGGCSPRAIKGDGNVTTERREIADFSGLQATGALEVEWSSGAPALSITTDENLMSHIRTEVSGKELEISYEGALQPSKGIKIVVSSGGLERLNLTGAVLFHAKSLSASALQITAAGSAMADLGGSASDLTAELAGASRLSAPSLQAKSAKLNIVGAGSADVAVEETLRVDITGAGSVTYSGNPKVEKHVTGAGSIQHR